MFKGVKSEVIKLLAGKMIYICVGLVAILSGMEFFMTKLLKYVEPQQVSDLSEIYPHAQRYILISLSNLLGGGPLLIMIIIIMASIMTEEYGRGILKYSLMALSRTQLMLSKLFVTGAVCLILVMTAFVTNIIIGYFAFDWAPSSYSFLELFGAYLIGWLVAYGFACVLIFMNQFISKVGVSISLGFVFFIIVGLLSVIIPDSFKAFLITANFVYILDMEKEAFIQLILNGSIYIILFSLLSILHFNKKELLY